MAYAIKRKKVFIITVVAIIAVIALVSIVGCSINGFEKDDFEFTITSIRVDGNKVTVVAQLKNNSWRNGWVVSSGLIHIVYEDEGGNPEWGITSIAINNWISCKQKITKTQEYTLEKGRYTIKALANFSCNNNKDKFHYIVEATVEI